MIGSFKQLDAKRRKLEAGKPGINLDHPVLKSPLLPYLGSLLSGVLLALGFPGFGNATLMFVALVPLMFAVHSASVKRAAGLSLLSGFVFFMMSLWWLINLTGRVEGAGLKVSAVLGFAVLALYCALYFVPFGIAVALGSRKWVGNVLWKNIRFMFAVSLVWVGSEYLRGIAFTGFPWNPLGVSQYANATLIQVAEWGGVSIVSACIVFMNAGAFITFRQYTHGTRAKMYKPHFELMIGIMPVALSVAQGMNVLMNRQPRHETVTVALVQPNIEQQAKWDSALEPDIKKRLSELTATASRLGEVDLIIWPETALPQTVNLSAANQDQLSFAAGDGIPLLIGANSFRDGSYFNSSIFFNGKGHYAGHYDKQHLVPFGEYVPFPGLMRKFTPIEIDFGRGESSTVIPLKGKASFSPLICFEDTVAPLSRRAVLAGARWLVNQTNDGWFDPSAQSEQHLAHAVFRCVENRVPMARCTNTGVSGIIDAFGVVGRQLKPMSEGFTAGLLYPRQINQEKTFYTRKGNVVGKAGLVGGIGVLVILRGGIRIKRRKKTAE
ncbi:apolipoprotein N-acyltransferase [Pontiella agarivorans]|uniref:Apolipoprotein N-acyltransferase n=1 Tax=Pontiella agarivorans TaxID=3038953 RepID=A0ABU5MUZ1_9BACT|nr:apolipoprotein N-acyltransferase [Pontiella agarivorans]MDZ8117958.1 apolipoprotein N-acyltransferase [Pontiella agarivorans]